MADLVRSVTAVSLLVLLALPLPAQQPRFRSSLEVRLIEIDVVVTDRHGNRVHGLTRGDFEIFEGRKRQEISNFSEYRRVAPQPSPLNVAPELPAAPIAPRKPRFLLVLVDWLPRDFNVRARAFEQLDALLPKLARQGDRVGLAYWNPSVARVQTIVEPTSDVDAVAEAIRRLGGMVTGTAPATLPSDEETNAFFEEAAAVQRAAGIQVSMEEQDGFTKLVGSEIELLKIRRKARALERLIQSFGAGSEKKVVLYVSHDFGMPSAPGPRLSAVGVLGELARAANAAGVTFYAVRPVIPEPDRGAGASRPAEVGPVEELARQMDALRQITTPTGGLVDLGPAAVGTLGDRMAEDLESYYSIAFRATSDGTDRERSITVRAKNPEYRVRSRKAYVEKSDETLARETVLARLFGAEEGDDLAFEIVEGKPERSDRNRWLLPLVVRIPTAQLQFASDGGERVARVKVMIVAANGVSEVTKMNEDDLRIVEGKHTVRGSVDYAVKILVDRRGSELSIGVMDRRSGAVGVRTIDNRGRFR